MKITIEQRYAINAIIDKWQKDNNIDASMQYGGSPLSGYWSFSDKEIAIDLVKFLQENYPDEYNALHCCYTSDGKELRDFDHVVHETTDWNGQQRWCIYF